MAGRGAKHVSRLTAETVEFSKGYIDLQRMKDEIAHQDGAAKKVSDELEAMKVEIDARTGSSEGKAETPQADGAAGQGRRAGRRRRVRPGPDAVASGSTGPGGSTRSRKWSGAGCGWWAPYRPCRTESATGRPALETQRDRRWPET
ncbi:MAG: hypothetical protein WKF75_19365 [Singulisphaera sp.]